MLKKKKKLKIYSNMFEIHPCFNWYASLCKNTLISIHQILCIFLMSTSDVVRLVIYGQGFMKIMFFYTYSSVE